MNLTLSYDGDKQALFTTPAFLSAITDRHQSLGGAPLEDMVFFGRVGSEFEKAINGPQHDTSAVIAELSSNLGNEFTLLYDHCSGDQVNGITRGLHVYSSATSLVYIYVVSNSINVDFCCTSKSERDDLNRILGAWANSFKAAKSDEIVSVVACYMGTHGPEKLRTTIRCPALSSIRDNYSPEVMRSIDEMPYKSIDGGRLVIWHGEPGTGKTWAIKALLNKLNNSDAGYNICIVVDPELILSNANYYYSMVDYFEENYFLDGGSKPIFFVMEDSANSMLAEGRGKFNGAITKLLNITDGLLTKGREDLFLVTFNEDVDSLDPAIIRPGRCAGRTEFKKLSIPQSNKWLKKHCPDKSIVVDEGQTIASLYAMMRGDTDISGRQIADECDIGFDG